MRRRQSSLVAGIMALLLLFSAFPVSVFAAPALPPTSTSWYAAFQSWETDANINSWMYSKGYELGRRDYNLAGTQSSIAILHFFRPMVSNGVYGASGHGRFMSVSTIKEAVRQFARGYYMGTGTDYYSMVRILIGTTNDNSGGAVTYAHGQAWSQLVRDADAAIVNSGYGGQAKARGAIDIEMSYSTYAAAKSWIDGYNSRYVAPYVVYNYGDAGGCPSSGASATPGLCNNNWNQDNITAVTWRHTAGMYPVPQIYNTAGTNAKQWQQIALFGKLKYNMYPAFSGSLSQKGAWDQKCAPRNPLPSECQGVNNTPSQAWDQLWTQLNSDSRTAGSLTWSTDIKWR